MIIAFRLDGAIPTQPFLDRLQPSMSIVIVVSLAAGRAVFNVSVQKYSLSNRLHGACTVYFEVCGGVGSKWRRPRSAPQCSERFRSGKPPDAAGPCVWRATGPLAVGREN